MVWHLNGLIVISKTESSLCPLTHVTLLCEIFHVVSHRVQYCAPNYLFYILMICLAYLSNLVHATLFAVIERVRVIQFLGVFIGELLNWKAHITYVQSEFSKSITIMHRCSHLLDRNTKCFVYNMGKPLLNK